MVSDLEKGQKVVQVMMWVSTPDREVPGLTEVTFLTEAFKKKAFTWGKWVILNQT